MADNIKENDVEKKTPAFDFRVSEDRMEIFLSCPAENIPDADLDEGVSSQLKRMRITAKPDTVSLKLAVEEAKKNSSGITDFLLASGKAPIQPIDGKIEWTGDYFKTGYYIDPNTKRIDFKQKRQDPTAEKDQLLVKVQYAKHGKNGLDVFGRSIVVPRPKEVHLRGGPNVYWDSEVKGFRAKCPGRVTLRGQTLNVDQVYCVQNVGNQSGNIKHNGSLVVKEEVTNDYKIDVTGDIEIGGMVYACDINCGGNLTTKEGINGQLSKKVFVKGDMYTKYLQNANVETLGNIYANTEIYQSVIQTKGTVNCNEGRVIGGETLATKGITIGEAGSKGNVKTILIAGVDKELQQKMKSNCDEITELKKIIKKLQAGHRKLQANIRLLNTEQKEKMTQISSKIKEAEEEISKLENENQELSQKIRDNSVARINILKIVYPGVVLRICQSQYIMESTLGGPIVAMIDPATHEIALTSDFKNE